MSNEIQVTNSSFLAPVVSIEGALNAWQLKKEFISGVLSDGVDFGAIPGAGDKKVLLKPGAEKMAAFFGLSPVFEDVGIIEDWTGKDHDGEPFFYYRQKCILHRGDRVIASADGSCNSWEKKYRYRNADRICPHCGQPAIIKGREEYGGGWLCYKKKGGCGAKFQDSDNSIVGQETGKIINPDISDIVNTLLKMAQKRALVAAVLIATNVSDYFTQDVEDYIDGSIVYESKKKTDTTLKTESPAPEQDNTSRPYSAEDVKKGIATKVIKYAADEGATVGANDYKVLASTLNSTLGDETKRYEMCQWLVGIANTKDMSPAQIKALLVWQGVSGFGEMPSDFVLTETRSCHTQALKDAGQQELI